ncbi:omwaprin-a-like [Eublepharis macularius]|uniref:Omwaprin-a-like n=1 Tax=Eublepharis macularius TaxID=481883 RepID=A0AA97JHZ7_EUBMA|nr:omwaprin-a-like [Eublepharis macularius]
MKSACLLLLLAGSLTLWTVVPSASAKGVKPGRCPLSPPAIVEPCVTKCKSDMDCPGDQKCCNIMCSWRCANPDKGRP